MNEQPFNAQHYINTAFQNNVLIDELWCYEDKISLILAEAIQKCSINDNNDPASICCDYFIDYVCVFLIKKPSDFLYIFRDFDQAENKITFMNLYFQNYLTRSVVTTVLLENISVIENIGEYQHWIEYPLKYRATKLIKNAPLASLTVNHLFPIALDLPEETKDYLLSWAFAENKLAEKDIKYFQTHFSRSYDMLIQAKEKNKQFKQK